MNTTIAWITLRGLLGRRRFFLMFPLPVLVVGLTLVAKALQPDAAHWAGPIIDGLGINAMLPVTALIVGTAVLGSEIDDGTVVHILTKPLPRREIVLAKLAVAAAVTALVTAVPMFAVGVIAGSLRLGVGLVVGCVVASVAYSAMFIALSLLTRRPVLVGLVYVLLWEGLLGNVLSGTRTLSVQQYARTVAHAIAPSYGVSHVGLATAIVLSTVLVVGGTALAIDRLRSFTLTGETG